MTRIASKFAALKAQGRAGLVTFITAADPDPMTSLAILKGLPGAGADLIELGMPFSDPMADGPAIQASSLRALKSGGSMRMTLGMVRSFRKLDDVTPVILMGYYNPIYQYGVDAFLLEAYEAGVDGLIIVDLPPEEDDELCVPARAAGIDFIRLATPTTDDQRLPEVLKLARGFLYYVSVTGITGTHSAEHHSIEENVARLKRHSQLPIAVGFGIRTPDQAGAVARIADAAVIGSVLVDQVAKTLGQPSEKMAGAVLEVVRQMAQGVRRGRET